MALKMYRTRTGVLAAALGVLLTGGVSATASAQPASHPGPALSAQVAPAAQQLAPHTVYNLPCWTTFIPSAPHGAPMTQYFVNCNDYPVTVCPALITSAGTFVWSTKSVTKSAFDGQADDYDTAKWTYASTVESGQYTTVYCEES